MTEFAPLTDLLDADAWEVPRRLSPADCRFATGTEGLCPTLRDPDEEDDR